MTDAPLRMTLGTFDGEHMVGDDGKIYGVPANYASKSRMIEGDRLKMIITENGIIYKQIEPVPRRTFIGNIIEHDNRWCVEDGDARIYDILLATCSFYQFQGGEEVIAHAPKDNEHARYAAIESVISQT